VEGRLGEQEGDVITTQTLAKPAVVKEVTGVSGLSNGSHFIEGDKLLNFDFVCVYICKPT